MAYNKEIVRRFEMAFAANDTAVIDELLHQDVIDHNPLPDQKPGIDGFKDTIAFYKQTFPDSELSLAQVIGDGDTVATLWTVTGTQQAEFFGVPATGRQVSVEGMNFYRLADGRITDVWTQFDGLGLMQQLGAIPS
jgi:steroid delta-isomerase-like uncharacterized protein